MPGYGFTAKIVGGIGRLKTKMDKAAKAAEKSALDAMVRTAYATQANAVRMIHSGPKTGAVYGKHQASAPGEAPASDTGNLARSIKVKFDLKQGWAVVKATAPYAFWLEFGTTRMAPRPFMGPAFLMSKDMFAQSTRVNWRVNFNAKE
jgi:HK97 gp10 family phage protein